MKVLAKYELRSPFQVLPGSSVLTSFTPVRVVTASVGCRPYPIPYLKYVCHVRSPMASGLTRSSHFVCERDLIR
jgi:hypothetical protein